jgi:hypothetical protein
VTTEDQRAALDAADRSRAIIDAMKQSATLSKAGPRTGTHPMATPLPPATRGPQEPATAIPEGGTAFIPEPDQRRYVMAMALAAAVLAGFIIGKAL